MHFAYFIEAHFIFSLLWINLHLTPILLLLQSHVASFIADYIVSNPPVRFLLQLPLSSQFLPIPHLYDPSSPFTFLTTRLFFILPRLHLPSKLYDNILKKSAYPLSPITHVSPATCTSVFPLHRLLSQQTRLLKMGSNCCNSGVMLS